ncbi:hypothetical protein [Massilia soli]|uniref:Lipoprotein n=1 Tax=Massilia soli TaxID=2792854 RepID=A0ABS7SNE0_9BURK|nr:hypothetical protein [Massilia soli]MBZ2207197.1 hypothetical protein [Massilia soli]
MYLKHVGLVLAFSLLAGCQTTYTRADAKHFKSLASARIPSAAVPAFADCVLDGFQAGQPLLATTNVRQQRRSAGFRVETFAGHGSGMIIVSADIEDDGSVQLWESDAAMLLSTRGEREAFSQCLKQASS